MYRGKILIVKKANNEREKKRKEKLWANRVYDKIVDVKPDTALNNWT